MEDPPDLEQKLLLEVEWGQGQALVPLLDQDHGHSQVQGRRTDLGQDQEVGLSPEMKESNPTKHHV